MYKNINGGYLRTIRQVGHLKPTQEKETVGPMEGKNKAKAKAKMLNQARAISSVMARMCSLQKTVVISFCTLELTPPIRYSPSVRIPARQPKSRAFKYTGSRSLLPRRSSTKHVASPLASTRSMHFRTKLNPASLRYAVEQDESSKRRRRD